MRIFVDTNIILELFENRTYADKVDKILEYCEQNQWIKFISVGSFYTITYLTERMLRRKLIHQPELAKIQRTILRDILNNFRIAPTSRDTLQAGISDDAFTDLEDSYQHQTAITANCDIFLTINTKDFATNSNLKILSPDEFINAYIA